MNINSLTNKIISVHRELQNRAKSAVNVMLTIRNWLIGFYIVEYEQNGSDKAKYGDKLLLTLGVKLKNKGIKGLSFTNLNVSRQFYITYPRILQTVSEELEVKTQKNQTLSEQLLNESLSHVLPKQIIKHKSQKSQTTSDQFVNRDKSQSIPDVPPNELINNLSFSHFVELIKIKDNLKRTFYEIECIKGTWSLRELKRQINSLYYERSGLSNNKEKLSQLTYINSKKENNTISFRNPLIFEFLDLPFSEMLEENQLEKALMDNLQHFLLELGNGFCFEARQKRILIDDEYFYIDLVFYHRVLKCHVLIELKTENFNHNNIGQLKVYLEYYKDKVMQKEDNPPIGILLCTASKPQMVRYALADKDNMLIAQYKLQLPSEKELQRFIEKQLSDKL